MSGLENYLTGAVSQAPPDTTALEAQYGIRPGLYTAIIGRGEASGENATSPKGAHGRAQLMPATAAMLGVDPTDPVQNLDGGARYVAQLQAKYGSNRPDLIAAAYNAGPGAVDNHGGVPPYAETQNYVNRVTGALPPARLSDYLGGNLAQASSTPPAPAPVAGSAGNDAVAPQTQNAPVQPAATQPAAAQDGFTLIDGGKPAPGDGSVVDADTGGSYNAAQTAFINAHRKSIPVDAFGKPTGVPGSAALPYAMTADGVKPSNPGDYYIDLGGNLQRVPLSAAQQKARAAADSQITTGGAEASLANGLALGHLPELIGAARGALSSVSGGDFGTTYDQSRDVAREQLGGYANAHPMLSGIATAAGAIPTTTLGLALGGAGLSGVGAEGALGPTGEFLAGNAGKAATGEALPGAGNVLLRASSRIANAGLQGGGGGLISAGLQPNKPIVQQVAEGAAGGGVLQGAGELAGGAGNLLMRVPAVGNAARAIGQVFEPAADRASRAIREFAEGGPTTVDTATYVPGSQPTLAEATQNPGLMSAQRVAKSTPGGVGNTFLGREADQQAARSAYLDTIRGNNDTLADMEAARSASMGALRDAAFANTQPVDAQPVIDHINQVLSSPAGKTPAVAKTLGTIKGLMYDADGNLETTPQQLYGVRKAIGTLYSGADASDAKLAASQLNGVKNALDPVIEEGAPGFGQYLKAFNDASTPIDEQKFLLSRTLTGGKYDAPSLAKVKQTLNAIDTANRAPGVKTAQSVSDDTYNALQSLRDDLARSDINPSPAAGSPTYERMVGGSKLGAANLLTNVASIHFPGLGFAKQLAGSLAASRDAQARDAFYNMLLNPQVGASALAPAIRLAPRANGPLFSALGAMGGQGIGNALLAH